jgi:hypothetical protein
MRTQDYIVTEHYIAPSQITCKRNYSNIVTPNYTKGSVSEFWKGDKTLVSNIIFNNNLTDVIQGNYGTVQSGSPLVVTQSGRMGRRFNGSSDYIYFPDTAALSPVSSDFTMLAWIRVLGHPSAGNWGAIYMNYGFINPIYCCLGIYVNDTGKINAYVYADNGSDAYPQLSPLTRLGSLYLCVLTRSGANLKGYCNTDLISSSSTYAGTSLTLNSAYNPCVGRLSPTMSQYYYNGIIEEFAFWKGRTLSRFEIFKYYKWATESMKKYWFLSPYSVSVAGFFPMFRPTGG